MVAILLVALTSAKVPLDEYVEKNEPSYKWEMLTDATFESDNGNTVYVMNVTSLDWLDTSRAYSSVGLGTTWSHLVYVVVP